MPKKIEEGFRLEGEVSTTKTATTTTAAVTTMKKTFPGKKFWIKCRIHYDMKSDTKKSEMFEK